MTTDQIISTIADAELEPDEFFPSGPVRPTSEFVRSGLVEVRPVYFWRETG